ncbi:hypothetical protein BD408DRAFT_405929 [Parasitella parasitica]|nr:hypothetical protein BD408DRAFT_405929 [Parasitella parasitica]
MQQQQQQEQQQQEQRNETPVTREEKPTVTSSSSSSSFFRFFKSSNNNSNANSKNSSSASSVASVNAPSPIVKRNDAVNNLPPPSPPVRQQTLPPPPSQQHQQPIKPNHIQPRAIQQQQQEDEEDEEPEEPEEQFTVIEDEATRAFAEDNVISFKPTLLNYRSISPELAMDALKIDTRIVTNAVHKRLLPSISTPTNNMEDPWSNLIIQPTVEPSISSPLVVREQDIEPQKRSAFADLINSWNTGKSNNEEYPTQDPKEFFEHVAAERRDIGFAGIHGQDDDDQKHHSRQQLDYQDEMNPWN